MNKEEITLKIGEKIGLISSLSTMLSAGISILETVDSLLEDAKGNQRQVLEVIREDLVQGKHLFESFSRFPNTFDKVTVNIIHAAEEAGTLDVTLKDLRENIKKEVEFSDRVKNALIYPFVIFLVFVGVVLMILLVVIPQISTVFSRLKVTLPLPTKVLIFVSENLRQYPIPIVLTLSMLFGWIFFLYKTNRKFLLNLLFSLPLISDLAKTIDLTRFSRSFSLLLTAGIPITSALQLSRDIVIKKEISRVIAHSFDVVSSGRRLSEAFKEAKSVIPSIMIKITEAGERSGSLDHSMQEISEYLDYEVSQTLQKLLTLMEPILMVFVGILVGGMMLSIIAPIYNLIGQVGGR